MRTDRRSFLVLAGGGLAVIGLAACGDSTGATPSSVAAVEPPGPVDAGVGETVDRDGVSVTVSRVLATRSFGGFENAPKGTFYVTLEMSIASTGNSAPDTSFAATRLDLPGGGAGKTDSASAGTNLPQAGPPAGASTIGWRTFNVPDGTTAATLAFRPFEGSEIRIGFQVPTDIQSRMIGV